MILTKKQYVGTFTAYGFRREIPTVDKIYQVVSADDILPPISRTNLFHLLKDLDFRYSKRSRNSAMIEKIEIVVWRRMYLDNIKKYREEGRHIYFLDETWVNAGDCTSKTWVDGTIKFHRDAFLKGLSTAHCTRHRLRRRFSTRWFAMFRIKKKYK